MPTSPHTEYFLRHDTLAWIEKQSVFPEGRLLLRDQAAPGSVPNRPWKVPGARSAASPRVS